MRFCQARGQRGFIGHIVLRIGRIPNQRTARLQLGSHVGAHMFDRLKRADGAIKLLAVFGIVDRLFEHHLGRAQRVGSQQHPTRINHFGLRFVMIIARHHRRISAIKVERYRVAGFINHRQFGFAHPLGITRHHNQLRAAGQQKMGCGFRAHDKGCTTRNFIARQGKPAAFARARRFGQADAHHHLARGDTVEPIGITCDAQADNRHAISRGETRRRDVATKLLLNECRLQHAHAEPALRFRQQHKRHPQLHQPVLQIISQRAIAFGKAAHLFQFRRGFKETTHRVLQHGLVFIQSEIHVKRPYLNVPGAGFGSRGKPRPRSEIIFF